MKRSYCIYKITCRRNGRMYIGWSVNTRKRWATHIRCARYGYQVPLYRAMRKYGVHNFIMQVLATFSTKKQACAAERSTIRKYDTLVPNGYNIAPGGEGGWTSAMSIKAQKTMRRRGTGWTSMSFAERSKASKKGRDEMGWDRRSAAAKKAKRAMGRIRCSEAAKKGRATMGAKRRSEASSKIWNSYSKEEISRIAKRRERTMGSKYRSAINKRAWITRFKKYGKHGCSRV